MCFPKLIVQHSTYHPTQPPMLSFQRTLCRRCTRFRICISLTPFRRFGLCGLFPLLLSHVTRMIDVTLAVSDRSEHRTMSTPCTRCKRFTPRTLFERSVARSAARGAQSSHCANILHRLNRSDGSNTQHSLHRSLVVGRSLRAIDRSERAPTRPLDEPFERCKPCSNSTLCTRCGLFEPRRRSSTFGRSTRRRRCTHE